MKELTKYSRLAGYLEKLYDKLNADFFDGVLDRPVITIQSSSRSYGHYTLYDAWSVKGEGHKEINIAAGTLNRPIEYTVCTLLHEMCHQYNNEIVNTQDCSRGGTYHNKYFKQTAETHGLIVTRTEKYGWSTTTPSDELLEWILNNDILICADNAVLIGRTFQGWNDNIIEPCAVLLFIAVQLRLIVRHNKVDHDRRIIPP